MTQPNPDRLIRDVRAVVSDAEELLEAIAGNASDAVVAARERIEESLRAVKSRLERAERRVMGKRRLVGSAADHLRDEPWKLLAIAGGAGLLAGLLLGICRK